MNQMADNWWEIIKVLMIALAFTANEPNQWGNNMNFCVGPYMRCNTSVQMMKFWQMPLLLLPMSQYIGRIVKIFFFFFLFDHTYDTIFVWSMVNEGFYDEDDEISRNAIALSANEPKLRGNIGNFPKCNQIIWVAIPNEGNRQNFDNDQSICQYFSNLIWHFWKFRKCTDL